MASWRELALLACPAPVTGYASSAAKTATEGVEVVSEILGLAPGPVSEPGLVSGPVLEPGLVALIRTIQADLNRDKV